MNKVLPSTSLVLHIHALGILNHSAIDSKDIYNSSLKLMLKNYLIKASLRRFFIDLFKTLNDANYLTSFHAKLCYPFLNQTRYLTCMGFIQFRQPYSIGR